ncbi:MAG: VWA domain-containing protein, partial [Planctomycetes bacterium]|nr:VWA domain-containing protein [Planctomycetota bacterium]
KARLLVVGFGREQVGQLAALLPNFELDLQPGPLLPAMLEGAAVVVMAVPALAALDAGGAGALARFVARGGGLLVSGDGAKQVAPDQLAQGAREVLPVRLVAEAREKPPDPKLEETPGIAEVAKVSVCYVLDRSASMDAPIGTTQTTRWQVAVKGVSESLKQLSIDARAAVMTFTLAQQWEAKPQVFLPVHREQMGKKLAAKTGDNEYAELGFNTDIYAAVKAALTELRNEPSAVKMLIVMTDGADRPANARDGRLLSALREEAVAASINVVAIGIGDAFVGEGPDALSARRCIQDLATKPEFAYMPGDAADALNAHTIFVSSVETAFKAYDDKQKREEEERRRRLEEQIRQQQEPPRVDTAPGVFPVTLPSAGQTLTAALPDPAPRLGWYARNLPRADAAVALGVADERLPGAAVFALRGYGLGRTAFWAAGVSSDALAELAGWQGLPALMAQAVRWLQPREMPELRLVADASPEGIRLLDVSPEAEYLLRRAGGDQTLQRRNDWLSGDAPLAEGFASVIERIGQEERTVGDVFLAPRPAAGATEPEPAVFDNAQPPRPAATQLLDESGPLLALLALLLMLLPLERVVRRRS